ncbi:ABC transporter ATP-binding protein [Nocardioides sp. cx-173]|uniref:ABC transporter ATP-binding protein n=1 Tax=Nocardioides sp. cx-173 TaxID=2898796 RepID=UPI001E39B87A|nr:ABC transporter ATP-binding protein [Nocardioides sp. cx-173]MCD4524230.1 ABC transporter ATP-binding protein [Nocardioides sp. cx-173]UGB41622.1 ABC transporter ATP-binding protein [Nocardioides sp. cx-173]
MAGSGSAHLRGDDALLTVEDLEVEYRTKAGKLRAVAKISFDVMPGETLGIVGESGCGKSTTGRAVLRLDPIAGGRIRYNGQAIEEAKPKELRRLRREMQMIFQEPVGSLNPRRKVREVVVEGLDIAGASKKVQEETAERVLNQVGLDPARFADMLPRQLSGGQAQRVAIGRALAVEPKLLICDEPVSALDVSVQAQVINLLEEMKAAYDLTIVFIAHDLGVVRAVSDNAMVMYLGKVCEFGDAVQVYDNPAHPYTRGLLDSVPLLETEEGFAGPALEGDIPSPISPPDGCRFRSRCPSAQDRCAVEEPEVREVRPGQFAACHFPLGVPSADLPEEAVTVPV